MEKFIPSKIVKFLAIIPIFIIFIFNSFSLTQFQLDFDSSITKLYNKLSSTSLSIMRKYSHFSTEPFLDRNVF